MATPVSNLIALPQPAAGAPAARSSAASATAAQPFQTALAEAAGQATPAAGAEVVAATEAVPLAEDDVVDPADATGLAGALALLAQGLVPPAAPVDADADGAIAAPDAAAATVADTLTRSELLLRRQVGGPAAQAEVPAAQAVPDTRPNQPAGQITAPAFPVAPTTTPAAPTPAAPAPTSLPAAVNAVQPGQRQIVPLVSANIPGVAPVPAGEGFPTPVAAPEAPVAAVPLPDVRVGDRPSTAGEQFAAIASTAGTIRPATATAEPTPTPFANVLNLVRSVAAPPAIPPTANVATPVAVEPVATQPVTAQPVTPRAIPGVGFTGVQNPIANTTAFAAPAELASVVRPPVGFVPVAVEPRDLTPKNSFEPAGLASPLAAPLPEAPAFANNGPTPVTNAAISATPAVQVADGIVTHAHLIERHGETEFSLRLDPPELGRVQVHLTTVGDEVRGQVVVADDAVRRMIESQLPELRQRLEAAGVTMQQFDVTTDGTGGGRNPYRAEASSDFAPRSAASGSPARATVNRAPAGVLDVTV